MDLFTSLCLAKMTQKMKDHQYFLYGRKRVEVGEDRDFSS